MLPLVDSAPLPPPDPPAPPPDARREPIPAAPRYRPASWRQRAAEAFLASPSYGAALLVHALLLLGLSLWTIAVFAPERPSQVAVKLVQTVEVQRGEATPAPNQLASLLEAPDLTPQEASDAAGQDPSLGASSGATLVDAPVPFGLLAGPSGGPGSSAGQGKGKRGGGRRSGASRASDGARDAALEWLVRHRSQGGWGVVAQEERSHERLPDPQPAHTGLGLLCFLCAGHAPGQDGPYREVVERAEAWLVGQVSEKDGVFEASRGSFARSNYHQAIGTLALAEALSRRRTPQLEAALRRSVAWLEGIRGRTGWRYAPRQEADTSVTGWVVLALKSAEHAGVRVSPENFAVVRRYLDKVTREDGATGYTDSSNPDDTMTATGLFLRIMLGEPPTTRRNRAAARLVARLRDFDDQDFGLYGIYYAGLAMYQVGGPLWEEWNPAVRDKLVQGMTRARGCESGSWRPVGHTSDLLLSTTFATLTLQTYYRYLPVHAGTGEDGAARPTAEAESEPEEAPLSPGQLALDDAARALLAARQERDPGALLVAEAAYERAAELLREDQQLRGEALARLVEVAELGRDGSRALSRAEAYLAALPAGGAPDPAVLRVRRRERYRQLLVEVERLGQTPQAGRAARARELSTQAAALRGTVVAERLRARDEQEREEADRLVESLADLESQLLLLGEDDASLEAALREVERVPARGQASPAEARVLLALLLRAGRAFEAAARGEAAGWTRGEEDLRRLEARQPGERLTDGDALELRAQADRVELLRVSALLGLSREAAALEALGELARRWPPETQAEGRAALERTALARRAEAGQASPEERARFEQLLRAWSRQNPPLQPPERVALGERLVALRDLDEGARQLELAAARPGALSPEELRRAHLGLARARRLQGDPRAALAALDALPPGERRRVELRLERALALRAAGQRDEAIEDYQQLVRALAEGRPPEWWTVVEELARAYAEAGRVEEGRRHLAELLRLDPTCGGDEVRQARLARLMQELDSAR